MQMQPQQQNTLQERGPFPWKRMFLITVFFLFFAVCAIVFLLSTGHVIDYSWYYITPVLTASVSAMVTILQWLVPLPALEFGRKPNSQQSTPTIALIPPATQDAIQNLSPVANANPQSGTATATNNGTAIPAVRADFSSVFHPNEHRLTDPKEFFGRELVIGNLIDRIKKDSSTSIVGPRRIGKTWVLRYLCLTLARKLGPEVRIAYLDASLPSCRTTTGFLAKALEELEVTLPPNQADIGLPFLQQAVTNMKARNQIPVLCIDEFESLGGESQFDKEFFTGLRAIAQNEGGSLVLVTASKHPLIEIVTAATRTSPFFNIFVQTSLKPFNEIEAKQFFSVKGKQAGFTDEEQAYLLEYTRDAQQQWHPLRLQLAGELLQEDKYLAATQDPGLYRPGEWEYRNNFKERLEEKFKAVVSEQAS